MELQVGVKALIKNSNGEYLFLKRAEPYEREKKCRWDIPGGRINIGEPIYEALKREIKEETGLKMIGIPQVIFAQDILRGSDKHVVRITFTVKAKGKVTLDKKEHSEYSWVNLNDAQRLHHDKFLTPVFKKL